MSEPISTVKPESESQRPQSHEYAYLWLAYSEDFNVRNLRNVIKAEQVPGSDCFDLYGAANVLVAYREHLLKQLAEEAEREGNKMREVYKWKPDHQTAFHEMAAWLRSKGVEQK